MQGGDVGGRRGGMHTVHTLGYTRCGMRDAECLTDVADVAGAEMTDCVPMARRLRDYRVDSRDGLRMARDAWRFVITRCCNACRLADTVFHAILEMR